MTRRLEKLPVPTQLPSDIADYKLVDEVPYSLRSVNAIMANNGVNVQTRSAVLAFIAINGVEGVLTDASAGRFSVSLSNGQTFGTGY